MAEHNRVTLMETKKKYFFQEFMLAAMLKMKPKSDQMMHKGGPIQNFVKLKGNNL